MSRHTRAFFLLVGAAVGLATVSPLAPASADAVQPVFSSIQSEPGHPEVLRVTVTSDSAIASVVIEGAGSTWTATKDGATDVWVSEPLTFDYLGSQFVYITATDQEGDRGITSAMVDYRLVPHLESHTLTTTPLTFENPTVTASGRFTAYDPRTRSMVGVPEGNVSLEFTSPSAGNTFRTWEPVAADGTYSVTDAPARFTSGENVTVTVSFSNNDSTTSPRVVGGTGTNGSTLDSAEVPVTSYQGRVLLDATSLTVKEQVKAVVRGVVQRQVGGVWEAVPGVHVYVDGAGLVTSGSDGRFTGSVALVHTQTLGARIEEPVRGVYLRATEDHPVQDTVAVKVIRLTKLSWESRNIDEYWDVDVEGRISVTSMYPDRVVRVYLQDSANGRTGWRNVAWVKTDSSGYFSDTRTVLNPSRYHRLAFYGATDMQPSVTRAYRLSRHATRIAGAKATPSKVSKGGYVKLTGWLQKEYRGKFVSLGKGRYIDVFFVSKATGKVTYKGYTKTSTSTGWFSKKFKATRDGYWVAVWFTTSTRYVNAYSYGPYVNVIGATAIGDPVTQLPPSVLAALHPPATR